MSQTVPHKKSKARPIAAVGLVLSLIVIVGCSVVWWRYYATPSLSRYDGVIAAFKDHKIPIGEMGRVDLSKQFPGITGHNDAYITYRDDGNFVVMFPTYYGKGQEVSGLVYTSRKLTEDDTHARISAMRYSDRLIVAGSYENLLLDKRIDDHWYMVSYRIH